ncbi:MAG TPA: D-glycero-beta-D-manno-heptose-7-phosphate kinase [Steroidobacteraceae bacterium]|nr:D-glycero-beta-D-manno-heptose-7-phosphate kinase [Steroidobacteraceae bacterium]
MSTSSLWEILESVDCARVLVFGDVMLDRFIYGTVERMCPEAPIPVLNVERTTRMPGGAANVARNVAALGAQAILVGVVGADEAAEDLRSSLAETPSIRAHLIEDDSRPTTLKIRHLADRQPILRTDVESRAALDPEVARAALAAFGAALRDCQIVILSDYAKGALSDAVTAQAIAAARAAGRPVLVDPKSRSFEKYRGTTILTPNRAELQSATGTECASDEDVVAAARTVLAQKICDTLVVTRGKDGMSVVRADGTVSHIRTVASEVYEVTGAGDTVLATLAVSIAGGAELGAAARLANIAAGIVVGKFGTATVTAPEIMTRLDSLGEHHAPDTHFTLADAMRLVTHWRDLGLRIAFTNGCFDLLHPGHVALLNQAKQTADRLIVGLNSDASVRRLKGAGRPAQNALARATVLTSLKAVDAVVIFEEDTPLKLIEAIAPDVLVKGADYSVATVVGAELVSRRGGRIVLADLVPAHSTTSTIDRITAAGKV